MVSISVDFVIDFSYLQKYLDLSSLLKKWGHIIRFDIVVPTRHHSFRFQKALEVATHEKVGRPSARKTRENARFSCGTRGALASTAREMRAF